MPDIHTRGVFRALLLLCLIASLLNGEALDDYVLKQMELSHVPGAALAIVRNGRVEKLSVYGVANVEWNAPVDERTRFQIASATKPFTGVALLKLVEAGKLGLGDSVRKHVPALPESWARITVRDLATHVSGVPEAGPDSGVASPEELVKQIATKPLVHAPGERATYGLSDFAVLARVMEVAAGMSFSELLRKYVLEPMEIRDTGFTFAVQRGPSRVSDPLPHRATVYRWEEGRNRISEFLYPVWTYSAGGLHASISDVAKLMAALQSGRVLKQESLDQMWAETKLADGTRNPFAVGWTSRVYAGRKAVGHTGGPGLGDILHFPEEQLSIVVLTNQQRYYPYMAEAIADRMLKRPSRVPPPVEDEKKDLSSRLRRVIVDAQAGKVAPEAFGGKPGEGMVAMLRDLGPTYFASLGELTHFDFVREKGSAREYLAWFAGKPLRFTFEVDEQGRVTRLEFQAE